MLISQCAVMHEIYTPAQLYQADDFAFSELGADLLELMLIGVCATQLSGKN